jgi:tryptophan synthase alpha chain
MSKITEIFAVKKPLIAYITAGDKSLRDTKKLIFDLQKNGVDILELGIPFSDSLADGPVIQDSHHRAIASGTTLALILALVKKYRKKIKIPLVFMSAANLILAYGLKQFFSDAAAAGVDGLIIPDLPPEEAKDFIELSKLSGLDLIFLAATTSSEQRLKLIAENSTGFVYCIATAGVTGERASIAKDEVRETIIKIKSFKDIPVAVGFGVSTPEQATAIYSIADGVIIGSAIVRRALQSRREAVKFVRSIIKKVDKK